MEMERQESMPENPTEYNGVVREGGSDPPEAMAEAIPYDPFAAWDSLTPEQQLHQILTTYAVSDWVKEPMLSVLAWGSRNEIYWAQIVLAWREQAQFTKLQILEDAIARWFKDMGIDEHIPESEPPSGAEDDEDALSPHGPVLDGLSDDWTTRIL